MIMGEFIYFAINEDDSNRSHNVDVIDIVDKALIGVRLEWSSDAFIESVETAMLDVMALIKNEVAYWAEGSMPEEEAIREQLEAIVDQRIVEYFQSQYAVQRSIGGVLVKIRKATGRTYSVEIRFPSRLEGAPLKSTNKWLKKNLKRQSSLMTLKSGGWHSRGWMTPILSEYCIGELNKGKSGLTFLQRNKAKTHVDLIEIIAIPSRDEEEIKEELAPTIMDGWL